MTRKRKTEARKKRKLADLNKSLEQKKKDLGKAKGAAEWRTESATFSKIENQKTGWPNQ